MLLFAEGFDDFAVAADVAMTAAFLQNTANISLATGRTGSGKALKLVSGSFPGPSTLARYTFLASSPVIVGCAMTTDIPSSTLYAESKESSARHLEILRLR